ncbi:MAG: hypothetical protein AAF799_01580 [Myxococcota bacterium]
MPTDILDVLAARQTLATTPRAWFDAAEGEISIERARELVADREDPALIERSAALFRPGDPRIEQRRLRMLVGEHFPVRRRSWRQPLLIGVSLAAALLLVLNLGDPASRGPGSVALAQYSIELERSAKTLRGDEPPSVAVFFADRRLRATLRPWTAITTPVEAAAYVCEADGSLRPLPLQPRASHDGVIVVDDAIADLGLGLGLVDLVFVVGPRGELPVPEDCRGDALLPSQDHARTIRTRIEIQPPPG